MGTIAESTRYPSFDKSPSREQGVEVLYLEEGDSEEKTVKDSDCKRDEIRIMV